ncbi:MAG: Hpt domain-containing protein [Pseudomonadota bacterium]
MADLSDKAQALLEAQRTRYLASFGEKAANLRNLWKTRGESDGLELIDAVHRIAGSAGLHGQDEVRQLAAQCEQVLKDSEAEADAQRQALAALVKRLEA